MNPREALAAQDSGLRILSAPQAEAAADENPRDAQQDNPNGGKHHGKVHGPSGHRDAITHQRHDARADHLPDGDSEELLLPKFSSQLCSRHAYSPSLAYDTVVRSAVCASLIRPCGHKAALTRPSSSPSTGLSLAFWTIMSLGMIINKVFSLCKKSHNIQKFFNLKHSFLLIIFLWISIA